ncbi:hypothetical protein [Aeromonas molluscorum]|uniref:Lipoprotein n=1 Tax=Aeromonas molluscorum 848 TaxID=1268236 RepID=R1F8M2_9GAMM|nr:hypothetical protein [Aeromonas molluscorum]EOD56037.1 hypothetical protein G113_05709 [Aeromonas molluscorum 848]
MKIPGWPLLAFALSVPAHAGTATSGVLEPTASARAKVAEFLVWERSVKPSGLYQADLGGALPNIVSPELLCLLNAASKAREIATRETPDEKPPFVEGNPFLPNAWDHLLGSQILSSSPIPGHQGESKVKVRFTFGEPGTPLDATSGTYRFVSTYQVKEGPQGARITDIDAGGSCDFCQSGSLRAALVDTLAAYPAAGAAQCKGLAK